LLSPVLLIEVSGGKEPLIAVTCGNAFSGPLDVVGDRRARPDLLRTMCGPLTDYNVSGSSVK
jgi:hypothetical protein